MIKCKSLSIIIFFLLCFYSCSSISENNKKIYLYQDSPIKELLSGKSLGIALFPVYFLPTNLDSLSMNIKLDEFDGLDYDLVLPEVLYSFGMQSENIQNSIKFQLKGILKNEIFYTYKSNKKWISNSRKLRNSKSDAVSTYFSEIVPINRVLDPQSLSRGFLWSVGDQHHVDLLLLGSLSIESGVFKLRKINSYFLFFKIEPVLNIRKPQSGEYLLSKNEINSNKDPLIMFIELKDINEDEKLITYLKYESEYRELLIDFVIESFMPYYPFLSGHGVARLD